MSVQPCEEGQVTLGPNLSPQLTCPATSIDPRQKPPGAEQPPGTQSLALLQPVPSAGSTHDPPQHVPRTCPARKHICKPFGVFAVQLHSPAEHPIELFAQVLFPHVPQLFGSVCRSTHLPLHEVCPEGHLHIPA